MPRFVFYLKKRLLFIKKRFFLHKKRKSAALTIPLDARFFTYKIAKNRQLATFLPTLVLE
jgi:hypothetical protein